MVSRYAKDKDAKWGAKNKNTVWFGYKRNVSIDCKYGLIEKVSVTPANISDYKAIKNIAPKNKGIYTAKGYDHQEATIEIQRIGSTHLNIQNNNKKDKNFDRDNYTTRIRMPFEGTLAHMRKQCRYTGIVKTSFQVFMESIAYNLKKSIAYESAILHAY